MVIANEKGKALVYRTSPPDARHWVAFKLIGTRSNRSAIGAEVTVEFGEARQRQVVAGGSAARTIADCTSAWVIIVWAG